MSSPNDDEQQQSNNTPILGVRVPNEVTTKLKDMAASEGRTTSDIVRRALRRELDRTPGGEVHSV